MTTFYLEDKHGIPVGIGDTLYREITDDLGEIIDYWYCKIIIDEYYQIRFELIEGTQWSGSDELLYKYTKGVRLIDWEKRG